MATEPNAAQPIPEGYHTVTPWISSRDTASESWDLQLMR